MVRKLTKPEFYSLILIIILQVVAIAAMNMLIPSYGIVIEYYGVDKSFVGLPDATFILVSAGFAVFWGYFTDRIDRARVIFIGAFLWSIGVTFTASNAMQDEFGFFLLILSRGLTGAGMGCVLPVAYSILADLIPAEERSGYFGTMAILSSVSNGIGQGLSSFIGPLNIFGLGWRFPFFLISIASVVIIILLFFIKIPQRGSHEEELETLQNLEIDYVYQVSKKDLVTILKKKTNLSIFIQGFFSIIPGTLVVYFLTTLFSDADIGLFKVLPNDIRLQTSSIMAALVGIGYLVGNSVLSGLGDVLFKKNRRNRVILGAVSLFISVPSCILFLIFAIPLDASIVPELGSEPGIFKTLMVIFTNYPTYLLYFLFAFIGSFFSAAPVANRGAIMMDVNLPEHRGTTTSFFNLAEQVGKGITLALSYVLLTFFDSYSGMILFAVLFWIPAGFMWYYASKKVINDMNEKSMILKERSQLSIIDYIFDLEIKLDQAIQLVHDSNRMLGKDNKQAVNKFDKATRMFSQVENGAKRKGAENLELASRAHNLSLKALMLKGELKNVLKDEKTINPALFEESINQLKYKIEEWWEPSDLGKIEILYESGILKIAEARLERKYDLFRTMKHLQEAIEIIERAGLLAHERLLDENIKKLNAEEKEFQAHVKEIINSAEKTRSDTQDLKEHLQSIIEQVKEQGVSRDDFQKIITLAAEYKVPYPDIIEDFIVNKKLKHSLAELSTLIDQQFKAYEKTK